MSDRIQFLASAKRSDGDAQIYTGYVGGEPRLNVYYRPDMDRTLPWMIVDMWEFRRLSVADESELQDAAGRLLEGAGVDA